MRYLFFLSSLFMLKSSIASDFTRFEIHLTAAASFPANTNKVIYIADNKLLLKKIPIKFKRDFYADSAYLNAKCLSAPLDYKRYPNTEGFDELNSSMHEDGNNSDIMKSPDAFFVKYNQSVKGEYYRVDPDNNYLYRYFMPGFCPSFAFFNPVGSQNSYLIQVSFGSKYSKLFISKVEKNGLTPSYQIGVPGREITLDVHKIIDMIFDQKSSNVNNFTSTAGGAYFIVTKDGKIVVPVYVKNNDVTGLMVLKMTEKNGVLSCSEKYIIAKKSDQDPEGNSEYINAVMPYNANKIWATSSTGKVYLIDLDNKEAQHLSFDINIQYGEDFNNRLYSKLKEQMLNHYTLKDDYASKTFQELMKYDNTDLFSENKESLPDYKLFEEKYLDHYSKSEIDALANSYGCKGCYSNTTRVAAENCLCCHQGESDFFCKNYLLYKFFYQDVTGSEYGSVFWAHNRHQFIQNSFGVDENKDIYVVTNYMLCKFHYDEISNQITYGWDTSEYFTPSSKLIYNNSFLHLPGQLRISSGTSPTVIGNVIAITDNDFPTLHMNIYDKRNGKTLDSAALFKNRYGACENSVVGFSDNDEKKVHLIVSNTYGYNYAFNEKNSTQGGVDKFSFDTITKNLTIDQTWSSNGGFLDAKTATPKMSIGKSGLVYAYNKKSCDELADSKLYPPWQLDCIDFNSGKELFSVTPYIEPDKFQDIFFTKSQRQFSVGDYEYTKKIFDNIWGTFTMDKFGNMYMGTLRGFIRIQNPSFNARK